MSLRNVWVVLVAFALTGCVVGQSIKLDTAEPAVPSGESALVNLEVKDKRSYVVSGDKAPYFIGKYRAGFGIPYDVSTDDYVPLAEVIRKDLVRRLQPFGAAAAKVRVVVDIREWNFDTYQNGTFDYELLVTVDAVDGSGRDTETLKESIGVTGTFWGGGKAGFERDMPGIFERVMAKVVAPESIVQKAIGAAAG